MARKEKVDYVGTPKSHLYVVWDEGKWRIYVSDKAATNRFLKASDKGNRTQLIKYVVEEVVGEANIKR